MECNSIARVREIKVSRATITYGNGQSRDHVSDVTLQKDTPTLLIERGLRDYLFVANITLMIEEVVSSPKPSIEVLGLVPVQNSGLGPKRRPGESFAEMSVLYGTTRKREADRVKYKRNLVSYGPDHENRLAIGVSIITIPTARDRGTISRPPIDWVI